MKFSALWVRVFSGFVCVCGWSAALAQTVDPAAERARILQERVQVESTLRQAEQDCLQRFFVTPCVEEARRQQRGVLANLKQRENLLDDLQRKQRAAARAESLADKAAKKNADIAATLPLEVSPAASEAETSSPAVKPVRPTKSLTPDQLATLEQQRARSQSVKDAEAARRAMAQREKLEAAARRKAAAEKRNAERAGSAKPASPGLPSPGKPPAPSGQAGPAASSP